MTLTWKEVIERASHGNPPPDRRVEKTEAEWQASLTPEAYQVTRRSATERPNTSEFCQLFESGQYACVCCDTLLFDSQLQFKSGSGWPSFSQPVKDNVIDYLRDDTLGMSRIETTCSTCDAHLGHVFPDGPEPSGLRYCMNGVALKRVSDD